MSDQPSQSVVEPSQAKSLKIGLVMAVFALVITLAVAGYGFQQLQQMHQAVSQLQAQSDTLKEDLNQAEIDTTKQAAKLHEMNESTQQKLAKQSTQSQIVLSQLQSSTQAMKRQLSNLNIGDLNQWRIYETQYLIHLAARKAWLEGDLNAARSLLKSADHSIQTLHDPQFIPLRRALADDQNVLKELPDIDIEGISIKLNSLRDQIAHLDLAQLTTANTQSAKPAATDQNWKNHVKQSLQNFMNNFITIRRHDKPVIPLISAEHTWYLKQNLQLQLQQAALAAGRHQQKLYKQSIAQAQTWMKTYFTHNPAAQNVIDALDKLGAMSVAKIKPEQLKSVGQVDKIIEHLDQPSSSRKGAQ